MKTGQVQDVRGCSCFFGSDALMSCCTKSYLYLLKPIACFFMFIPPLNAPDAYKD